MRSFILRRLLLTLPVLLGVVTLVFSFIHLVPGDPVQIMLGEGAQAADIEQLRHKLGLDQPVGLTPVVLAIKSNVSRM